MPSSALLGLTFDLFRVLSRIFGALGAYAALIRRAKEGGSYLVRVTLCRCSMLYGTLGYFDRGDLKRGGEEHQLIPPDMFEAETPLGVLRRPAPCVEFTETKGFWDDPVLRYRGSDKPEWLHFQEPDTASGRRSTASYKVTSMR
jgi:hypothetical protein